MKNDSKLRGASKVAKDVRSDRGAPGKNDSGHDREDGSRVFEVGDHVHEPPQIYQASENPHEAGMESLETQLVRHRNSGGQLGDLDAVDRSDWPDTPELESQIMGQQGSAFRPPNAAGVSTTSRPPHPPVRKPSGARS